jgi:hypothetical protein
MRQTRKYRSAVNALADAVAEQSVEELIHPKDVWHPHYHWSQTVGNDVYGALKRRHPQLERAVERANDAHHAQWRRGPVARMSRRSTHDAR